MVKCDNSILSIDRYYDFWYLCLSIFNELYDLETIDISKKYDTIEETFMYLRAWYNPEKNNNPYYFIKYNLINRYNKKIKSDENYFKYHEKIKNDLFYDDDYTFLADDIIEVAKSLDDKMSNYDIVVTYQDIIMDRMMGFTLKEISDKHNTVPSLVHKKLTIIKNKCIEVGLFSD